jgi:sec-independent protein translocase protein TatC
MALVPFPGQPGGAAAPDPDRDPWQDEEEGELSGARMSFLEHLEELRRRLIISAIAICAGLLVSFLFIQRLFDFIMRPLQPPGGKLIYTEPTEGFILYIKIALLAGIVLAAPVIIWQLWLFVAPGLYAKEKRFALPFIFLGTVFFVLGALFSHYILFPFTWKFLLSFSNDYVQAAPKIESTFSLYSKMLLGMGVIFQMPTVVFFLAKMGVVTARFLIRQFKYAVLLIFIAAAVITPTGDMLTQTLFAAPMIGLYVLSIGIAWAFGRRPRKDGAKA